MKTFLKITAAGILLALPAVAGASQVNFEATNPCYTLLFDPSGCGSSQLPRTGFYRSYNCQIGSPYTPPKIVLNTTPPPDNKPGGNNGSNQTPPPNNGGNNNGNTNPPDNTPPCNPPADPTNPVITPPVNTPVSSIPAPQSGPMAAVGLGLIGAFGWLRSRRQARA
jgi:hypothetical protein